MSYASELLNSMMRKNDDEGTVPTEEPNRDSGKRGKKRSHDEGGEDDGSITDVKNIAPKAKKRPASEPAALTAEEMPKNILFEVRDGIRHLKPYWTTYNSNAKGRWIGRKMVDVFQQEFLSQNVNYAKVACKLGRIFINGKQMTDPNYVFQNNDRILHIAHRHEHPVLDKPAISFVADTDDLLVVNKPPSMPVHPCGQTGLRVLHRLDRTTSGILLFAKNYETDLRFKQTLKAGHWKKEYVAMVEGVFPETEIKCEEPIGTLVVTMGIQCIRKDGKPAQSTFRRVWTDGKVSVVRCNIETGRTHQIRVHLQYLGFPIVGDQLYNSDVWGPTKGKLADYGKPYETLCKDISDAHRSSLWHETVDPKYEQRMKDIANDETIVPEGESLSLDERPAYDPVCLGCNVVKRIPTMDHFRLHLHCLCYETEDWSFSTEMPEWAEHPKESDKSS
uniref:Pseudouridine synthase n=1 Tax=Steinernema glaseri TaxID=37863 RepID=A0A1I8ACK1_9BILA